MLKKVLILTFIFVIIQSLVTYAYTRPLGMGEAFTAVADDAEAIYRNPAGLAQLVHTEIATMVTLTNRDSINYQESIVYVQPLGEGAAGGVGYVHLKDSVVDSHQFIGSYGYQVTDRLSLGGSVKFYAEDLFPSGYSNDKASSAGLDLGALCKISEKWTGGLLIQNINLPEAKFENGIVRHSLNFRTGLAYKPNPKTILTLDMDFQNISQRLEIPKFYLGIDLKGKIGLRTGLYGISWKSSTSNLKYWTAGISFALLDYTFLYNSGNAYCHILGFKRKFK